MEGIVKNLPKNKSPGLDGLPAEFYQQYWHIIGKEVHKIISEGLDNGELTTSQKRMAITLLYKKGERKEIKNWRPLQKINTDRKIGSKVLSNRFKKNTDKIDKCRTNRRGGREIYQRYYKSITGSNRKVG